MALNVTLGTVILFRFYIGKYRQIWWKFKNFSTFNSIISESICRNFSNLWPSEVSYFVRNRNLKIAKWKYQKFPHILFVSPWYLPISTNLAQSDQQFSQIWSIYAKNGHFFCKGRFSLYFEILPSRNCL